jgi:MoaA/NifB/PqqE/SkfB family radical SAM enzyme
MRPVDAVLAVTFRCNARCAMCGIWKTEPGPELPPETYLKLPDSLRDVNLTGGEPFLREDLPAVHAAVRKAAPRARTIVSSNGLLTSRIVAAVREMAKLEPELGVAISLDGPPEVHDRLRDIPNAHDRALKTLRELQRAGFRDLRLAFTATTGNLSRMRYVYDLSRELGVQFTCAIQHGSEHYFHAPPPEERLPIEELRAQFLPIMRDELRTMSPKRWARAWFMRGQLQFVASGRRPLPCYGGSDFFFLDPEGDLFVCNAAPWKMGNLQERSFDEIWSSPEAAEARGKVARCTSGCWMICSARTAIRRAAPRVLLWALRAKFLGLPDTEPTA